MEVEGLGEAKGTVRFRSPLHMLDRCPLRWRLLSPCRKGLVHGVNLNGCGCM